MISAYVSGSPSNVPAASARERSRPPTLRRAPITTGVAHTGDTLATTNGSWSGNPSSYSYAWQDCATTGTACTLISGASSSAYTVQASDVGWLIRSIVTATNAGGSTQAQSSPTAAVTPLPPASTAAPSIVAIAGQADVLSAPIGLQESNLGFKRPALVSAATSGGSAAQGDTLATTNGSWSGNPSSYSYAWQDCATTGTACTLISGASSSAYTVQASDVGWLIRSVVTATNAGGSTQAQSSPTADVTPPAPVNTVLPVISGTAQQGDMLTTTKGTWSNTPSSYAYQWQDCSSSCTDIVGATTSSYTLQASDVADTIDVVVTATNAGGSTPVSSATTQTVTSPPPPAPVNTVLPVISGTAQQGDMLTTTKGTWSNTPSSYAYQWQDCSSSCTDIVGATTSSYTLQASDVADTIDVVVTATNAGGSTPVSSATTQTVTSPPPPAPVNTVLPVISGTAQQGDMLTTTKGTWSNTPSSYAYQWQDCSSSCTDIVGATTSSYTLQASDVADTIDVVVTATNAGGSTPVSSATTQTVTSPPPPAPVNTVLPVISGTAQQGDMLTTTKGTWSNTPSSYAYQWQDCSSSCTDIVGATTSSYTLQASDVADTIDVVVTATNAGGSTPVSSATTQTVTSPPPPAPVNTVLPVISGTAQQGDMLTTTKGTWSNTPSSYAYQWQDCSSSCTDIVGATTSSYTLQASDVADTIDVVVTATNAGGSTPVSSATTQTVTSPPPPAPVNTVLPVISGTAQQGDMLTTTKGTWSNTPSSYAYQWQDCSSSCTDIVGATTSSYTLQASDVADTIDVVVTATNAGGSTPVSSATTTTVTSSGGTGSPTNAGYLDAPVITGNTVVGDVLSTTNGTWANSPTSYGYQWEDCTGPTCSNISGATSSTYTVQASDVGHSLRAVVTATNGSGSNSSGSYGTAVASVTTVGNSLTSVAYLVGFSPPSGCSSLNATCIDTTNPPNWDAINQVNIFALGGNNTSEAPVQDATTTGSSISQGSSISSISATVSATIPAGPIMLTTDSGSPSSGSFQILTTSGAADGASSIPITGSPTANAAYTSGSAVMVQPIGNQNSVPTGSTLTGLVTAIHDNGAKALISFGGSNDPYWDDDCVNGYQYLLGAWFANYITTNSLDGMEIDEEEDSGSSATMTACWNGIGAEIHSIATAAGKVPIVFGDWNPTDNTPGTISALAGTKANIDQYAFEYYGYGPNNDYNCADNCAGSGHNLASFLSDATGGGIPAVKWLNIQGVDGGYAQTTSTVLGTTTSSESGSLTSIPISAVAAIGSEAAGTIPAGLVVLANTSSPPTQWQFLETSGVTGCTSGCSLPVTGSCTAAGWEVNTGTCTNSPSTTLNATYGSGSDIYFDAIGYPVGGYNAGGWDCGSNAAYEAAHNMLGNAEWFDDGVANTKLCFDVLSPFVTGGNG